MTAPYSGNFANTDNAVAAKLSLDIPADSVTTLKELAMYTGSLAANLEAAARFSADYMSYLTQMPQLQRSMNDLNKEALQTMRELQSVTDNMRMSQGFGPGQQMGSTSQYYNAMLMNRQGSQNVGTAPRGTYDQQAPAASPEQTQRDSAVNNYIQAVGSTPGSNLGIWGNPEDNRRNALLMQNGLPMGGSHPFDTTPRPGSFGPTTGSLNQPSARDRETERQSAVRERDTGLTRSEIARRAAWRIAAGVGTLPEDVPVPGAPGGEDDHNRRRSASETEEDARTKGIDESTSRVGYAQRFRDAMGSINNPLNDLLSAGQAGATPLGGRISLVSRLLQGAGSSGAAEGEGLLGGLSPVLKGAGVAGLGLAGAGIAFNAVQNVGEDIQGYRNEDVRGNTFQKGMGVQKDIMLMSLNPLISTEQSRSIIMGALNSGYQGAQYDNATEFVKKNLTDMNISISDSFKLLKTNVDLGGQSIKSLNLDLANIQSVSMAGGSKTDAQAVGDYKESSDFLVAHGADSNYSSVESNAVTDVFNAPVNGKQNILSGDAKAITLGFWNNSAFMGNIRQQYSPSSTPLSIFSDLSKKGELTKDTFDFLGQIAKQSKASFPNDKNGAYQDFYYRIKAYGFTLDYGKAVNLFEQVIDAADKGTTPLGEGQTFRQDALKGTINGKDASTLPSAGDWLSAHKEMTMADYNKDVLGVSPSDSKTPGPVGAKNTKDQGLADIANQNPDLVAIDPGGKIHPFDPTDPQQVIGFSTPGSGWKVANSGNKNVSELSRMRNKDGTYNTIDSGFQSMYSRVGDLKTSDLSGPAQEISKFQKDMTKSDAAPSTDNPTPGPSGLRGDSGGAFTAPTAASPNVANTQFIDLTPWAKKILTLNGMVPGTVPNDTNSNQANTGYNGATKNAPPPGNPGQPR